MGCGSCGTTAIRSARDTRMKVIVIKRSEPVEILQVKRTSSSRGVRPARSS